MLIINILNLVMDNPNFDGIINLLLIILLEIYRIIHFWVKFIK